MTTLNFPLHTKVNGRSPNESWEIIHDIACVVRRTGSLIHNLADDHTGWTLVVHMEHAPRDHEVYQLALGAGVDYVAMDDGSGVRLIGPRAAEWRPFPPERLIRIAGVS